MSNQTITTDQCGELLFTWFCSRCNSAKGKSLAQEISYKTSIFLPRRKLRLLEEMTFLYICLAVHAINESIAESRAIQASAESFLKRLRESVLSRMAEGDPSFDQRYKKSVGHYFEILREGHDAIFIANTFLDALLERQAIHPLEETLSISREISASQASLSYMFNRITIL